MPCHLQSAVPIQRCVGILQTHMLCILIPGLLLPILALKLSRVEKISWQKSKLSLQNELLSIISASNLHVLSASALISHNTVYGHAPFLAWVSSPFHPH